MLARWHSQARSPSAPAAPPRHVLSVTSSLTTHPDAWGPPAWFKITRELHRSSPPRSCRRAPSPRRLARQHWCPSSTRPVFNIVPTPMDLPGCRPTTGQLRYRLAHPRPPPLGPPSTAPVNRPAVAPIPRAQCEHPPSGPAILAAEARATLQEPRSNMSPMSTPGFFCPPGARALCAYRCPTVCALC